jgi:WD40 repeat protein
VRFVVPDSGAETLGDGRKGNAGKAVNYCAGARMQALVTWAKDLEVRVFDASSGLRVAGLVGHRGPITGVAFSPDSRHCVTASADSTMRVWSLSTGGPLSELLHAQHLDLRLGFRASWRCVGLGFKGWRKRIREMWRLLVC